MAGNDDLGNGYTGGFLCGICRLDLTDACNNCGPAKYWQKFEPRQDALDNPPKFPSIRKWHAAGYGEKLNILGFYVRAMMQEKKGIDRYRR